jgi:hypothetical protein
MMEQIFEDFTPYWKILAINFTRDSPLNRKIVKYYFNIGFWIYFFSALLFVILNFPFFDTNFEFMILKSSFVMMALICVVSYLVIYRT